MAKHPVVPTLRLDAESGSFGADPGAETRRRGISLKRVDRRASGEPIEEPEIARASGRPEGLVADWMKKIGEADLEAVRIVSRSAKSPVGRHGAVAITKLGNGWIYPMLAILIIGRWGLVGYRMIALAALNALLTHLLYPVIKRRFHRERPYEVDPRLRCLLPTLDEHSFPSGHSMTFAGVIVPIVILWPAMTAAAILMACGLAWSRVATAHHYPSDVVAGIFLGAGVGYPISLGVMSYW